MSSRVAPGQTVLGMGGLCCTVCRGIRESWEGREHRGSRAVPVTRTPACLVCPTGGRKHKLGKSKRRKKKAFVGSGATNASPSKAVAATTKRLLADPDVEMQAMVCCTVR